MTSTNGEDNDVRPRFRILQSGKVLLIALACVCASTAARAATIVVDGTRCTLAEAITAANTNVAAGGCRAGNDHNNGGDIIDLQVDVILATLDNIDADGCGNGLPTVSSRIRINGNDHLIARSSADGVDFFRLLSAPTGHLILSQVTVKNGETVGCDGGGIKASLLNVLDSIVSNNAAIFALGGGIAAQHLTLTRTTVADNVGGGIYSTADASLTDSTVTRNQGFETNTAAGVHAVGSLDVDHSTISDNQGGGRFAVGGGLFIDGTATFRNSTISNNAAQGDIGVGGGVMLFNGSATFTNTTISGNLALTGDVGIAYGGSGGGVFSSGISPELTGPGGIVTLIQSTVTNNSAVRPSTPGGSGGGVFSDQLTLVNTIVAGNKASNAQANDCSSLNPQYSGLNLIGDGSCDAQNNGQLTGDPMLGPLADNGGATLTHALLAGSPAIDRIAVNRRGKCSFSLVTDDQRDLDRVTGRRGACDIGAVEYTGEDILTLTGANVRMWDRNNHIRTPSLRALFRNR